jgi:hypothetical protein
MTTKNETSSRQIEQAIVDEVISGEARTLSSMYDSSDKRARKRKGVHENSINVSSEQCEYHREHKDLPQKHSEERMEASNLVNNSVTVLEPILAEMPELHGNA